MAGVYWVGQNGNYYVKSSTSGGVKDLGYAGTTNPNIDVINGLTRINDPMAPTSTMGVGADSASAGSYYPGQYDAPGSGTGAAAVAPTPPPDPYARWGGKANYDAQIAGFDAQKQGILTSADSRIGNDSNAYKSSILDLISGLQTKQRGVDQNALNNEMKYQQGTSDVRNMVGQGLQNAGHMLASRNATSSGSAQKFAEAYSRIGRQNQSKVGNQYALGQTDVANQQQGLEDEKNLGLRHLSENRDTVVNSIVGEAERSLYALDAAIAGADLPTRIAIEQEKQGIKQKALNALSQYDGTLNSGVAGVHGMADTDRRAKAHQLMLAGQAPADQFDFSASPNVELQDTGPFASQLPIFTFNRRNQQQTV